MNPNDGVKSDIGYMKRAYALAVKGKGRTSPNPAVGAVLVKEGVVVAEGWHQRCGGPHAEIAALKKAGTKAGGAVLYVTLEPCFHQGRTPPCVEAVIQAGIKQVVIGMKDPNPLTAGKSIKKLRKAGIKVKVGFMQEALTRLNEDFVKYIKQGMPFVVAKSAQTLDGKIATAGGDSKWITSMEARSFARKKRHDFDAILIGSRTALLDDPRLNPEHPKENFRKVVVDSALRVSPEARMFKGVNPQQCILAVTRKADKRKIDIFRRKGVQIVVCPSKAGRVSLQWLFRRLAQQEISSILIEGGAKIIGSALKEKLVDKMHIYIAPVILGDQKALSAVDGLKAGQISDGIRLNNISVQPLGQDLFVQGDVRYHS